MSGSHPHRIRAGRIRLRRPAPRAVLAGCAALLTVALAVAGPGGAWAAFTGTTAGTGNQLVTEAAFPDYRTAVQRSGPVVHHPFDDPYGSSTAAALAGTPGTYNGAAAATSVPTGAIAASSGGPRRAVHFPENAYAAANSTTSITGSGTAGAGGLPRLTLEAWVLTGRGGAVVSLLPDASASTAGATQLYINTRGEACVGLTLSPGTQEVCGSDSTDLKVWSSPTDTPVWRHIAAVIDASAPPGSGLCANDGAQVSVYLDGVVQYDSALCAGWPVSVTGRVRVGTAPIPTDGSTPAPDTWSGGIDEVAVYAAALNATEIKKHYDLGKGTVAGTYATSVTSFASLRMYWQLEEQPAAGALTVADASANNRGGTFHSYPDWQVAGAPTGTTPSTGTAVGLRGVNDISTGAGRTTPPAFSTEVWFSSSGGTGPLVSFGATQTGASTVPYGAVYLTAAGHLAFSIRTPQRTVVSAHDYSDGGWHLVTATMSDRGVMRLYVDGVLEGEDASSTTTASSTGFWRWGGGGDYSAFATQPGAAFFSGRLDEASVYDRELTPEEVAVHWGAKF
jgi:hypothetical protein